MFECLREPLYVQKVVDLVLYRLAHGYVATFLANPFYVGASTVCKCMDIILDIVSDEQKLSAWYDLNCKEIGCNI